MPTTATPPMSRRGFITGATASIAVLALGSLDACSSSSGKTSGSRNVSALYYYPVGGAGDTGFRKVAASIKAATKLEMSFSLAPVATYNASLISRIRTNTLPDLVWMLGGTNNASGWSAVSALSETDAGTLFKTLADWDSAEIFPGAPGRYFGLPVGTQGYVWYYNKAAYSRAGLNPEVPPTTWEQFTSNCARLKTAGIAPIGMGGVDGYTAQFAVQSLGPQYYTADESKQFFTGKRAYTDEPFGNLLNTLQSTYTSGWWNSDFKSKNSSDITLDFVSGRVGHIAGLIRGILDWGTYDTKMANGSYGTFAAPVVSTAPNPTAQMATLADAVLCINKSSKNKANAVVARNYFARPDSQATLMRTAGLMPNRSDVDISAATSSAGGKAIYDNLKTLPQSTASAYLNGSSSVQTALLHDITGVLAGGDISSFQKALTQAQSVGH